jgi:hypothetical protein
MLIRQIPLKHEVNVKAVNISNDAEIKKALDQLGIPQHKKVIVLVGGAGGIGFLDKFAMRKAVGLLAKLAEELFWTRITLTSS